MCVREKKWKDEGTVVKAQVPFEAVPGSCLPGQNAQQRQRGEERERGGGAAVADHPSTSRRVAGFGHKNRKDKPNSQARFF